MSKFQVKAENNKAQLFIDGKTLDIENVNATLGMNMAKTDAKALIASDESCEIPGGYRPLFCVEDDAAEVIASFDNGKTAVAKKGQYRILRSSLFH